MAKWIVLAAAGLAIPLLPAPATAQNAVQNGVLVIYGDDECPTDRDGNEIVVCARKPETERYRVPKELRDLELAPQKRSWTTQADAIRNVGATGIGSCSAVGAGGMTGCDAQMIDRATREANQREDAQDNPPLD